MKPYLRWLCLGLFTLCGGCWCWSVSTLQTEIIENLWQLRVNLLNGFLQSISILAERRSQRRLLTCKIMLDTADLMRRRNMSETSIISFCNRRNVWRRTMKEARIWTILILAATFLNYFTTAPSSGCPYTNLVNLNQLSFQSLLKLLKQPSVPEQ